MGTHWNNLHNCVYQGHLWGLCLIFSIVAAMHFLENATPFDLLAKLAYLLDGTSVPWQFVACFLTALLYWLTILITLRYTLKFLFMYKGWMYEKRGKGSKTSLLTKLWLVCVRILSGWNRPKLYSFQGSLPRLPLPSLHDTVTRYLKSVRPLLDDKNYERVQLLATEFESGIGKKLQMYVWLKSWWSSNYVSDWWEDYVYLRSRSPLMIKSNFYGLDTIFFKSTTNQAARAASAIYSSFVLRRLIENQELEPVMLLGIIPLCSWQYERLFNTTRIPGLEADKIQHVNYSNHVVVYHKGRYFKVVVYKGRLLKPCEIQIQMQQILDDESEPLPGEERLGALTAGERTHWANVRNTFFNRGVNKVSLDIIEKAAFFVTLDDFPYDTEDPFKLDNFGRTALHGKGCDRWFDKSFSLAFGTNGRLALNAEHSWADAAVTVQVWEHLFLDELQERYDQNGNTTGTPEVTPPTPTRLNWEIESECQDAIETSMKVANNLIEDLDLRVYVHNNYGKGFIKLCGVSPDAYIQMALQLAYYRHTGKFDLTYEASVTRLYKEGRTETVRPCSVESSAWVKAMENPNSITEERVELLKQACERHQIAYQDAMCGKGIDRHLFSLCVVSKYLEVESPFLQEALGEPWRLSTSQFPQGEVGRMILEKHPTYISSGGGFGPVADDGYGVSYVIAEDLFFFHVSNKKSCGKTDCHRFARAIEKSLTDMKALHVDYQSQNDNE